MGERSGGDWKGPPPPCFLQEYDSMGVKGWAYAKDVIPWELEIRRRLNCKLGLTIGSDTHPRVFFVRVADKGLTLDAASRASTFGELNAETQSAQRSGEEKTGVDIAGRRGSNMGNGSRDSYLLSIATFVY